MALLGIATEYIKEPDTMALWLSVMLALFGIAQPPQLCVSTQPKTLESGFWIDFVNFI